MSADSLTLDQRLKRLEQELEALQRIKTQEDYDEGARLHALHNAPWKKGQYSHLAETFPPYKFVAYPAAVYSAGFEKARQDLAAAEMIPAYGMDDKDRKLAILLAERAVAKCVRSVGSEEEFRKLGPGWFESPTAAVEYERQLQRDVEIADAHRAYEDRNMTGRAAEERDRKESEADTFVPTIVEEKRRPTSRQRIPASAVTGGKNSGKAQQTQRSGSR